MSVIECLVGQIGPRTYSPLTTCGLDLSLSDDEIGRQARNFVAGFSTEAQLILIGLNRTAGLALSVALSDLRISGLILIEITEAIRIGKPWPDGLDIRLVGSRDSLEFKDAVDSFFSQQETSDSLSSVFYISDASNNSAIASTAAEAACPLINALAIESQLKGPLPPGFGEPFITKGARNFALDMAYGNGTLRLRSRETRDGAESSISFHGTSGDEETVSLSQSHDSFAESTFFIRESLISALSPLPPNPENGTIDAYLGALWEYWNTNS